MANRAGTVVRGWVALVVAAACGGPPAPPPAAPGVPEPTAAEPEFAPPPSSPDRDGDTVEQAADGCPDDAEDRDNFADDDGCPDPDNDGDRISDWNDQCPNEPETYNGTDDEDGCPDWGLVVINRDPPPGGAERVRFEEGSARLRSSEHDLLMMVVQVLDQNPQVERVLIIGHAASDEGSRNARIRLSLRRAEAVVQFLLDAGVPPERLGTAGYGNLCPFDAGATEEGRDRDRVVTFAITRTGGTCTHLDDACPEARDAGLVPVDDCVDSPTE